MENVRSFPFTTPRPSDSCLVAGSGKSVLWFVIFYCGCLHGLKFWPSSGIIEDIIAQHETGSAIITYFYCDFRDEDKQNCRNLVLSIISQLCSQSDICCDTLSRVYLAHDKGTRKPSDETLTRCLTELVSLPIQVPIYIIVDALDECPNESGLPTPRRRSSILSRILLACTSQICTFVSRVDPRSTYKVPSNF